MPERIRIGGLWMAPAASSSSPPGARSKLDRPFGTNGRDARGLALVDEHAVGEHAALDLEIGPAAGRLEIAVIAGDAFAVPAVDGVGRDPFGVRRVEVVGPGVAQRQGRIAQRLVDGAPVLLRRAVDGDRAGAPVVRLIGEVEVGLEPVEALEHMRRRPALAALLGPLVEGVEDAANGDLAVDRGAAADAPAAPVDALLLALGAARHQLGPHVDGLELGREDDVEGVRARHLGRLLGRAVVRAGLQQQDPRARVLAQPCGERCTCRPGADDDVVPGHWSSSPRSADQAASPCASPSQQAAKRPWPLVVNPGSAAQTGMACGQRAAKLQPVGKSIGLGGSPSSRQSSVR